MVGSDPFVEAESAYSSALFYRVLLMFDKKSLKRYNFVHIMFIFLGTLETI